ncbi:hypothetical protein [Bdellovibrio bacteriovorus]|nr:hypothetical protein [Bdellovibrio bacteriovorus]
MKKLVLISMTTLTILGCSFPMEQLGLFKTGTGLPEIKPFSNDELITFDIVKKSSLSTCTQCHEFTKTADQVIANQVDILARINTSGSGLMPPPSKGYRALTDCEKQILVTWLDDQKVGRASPKIKELTACANQTTEPAPQPQPEPKPTATPKPEPVDFANLEVNFANLQKYILEPKCLRCHTPQAKDKEEGKVRTNLTSESEIQGQGLLDATIEKAVLYQVVVPGLNKRFMPPVRSGLPALTEPEVDYLKRWILSVPPNDWF